MDLYDIINTSFKIQNAMKTAKAGLIYDTIGLSDDTVQISIGDQNEIIISQFNPKEKSKAENAKWPTIIEARYNPKTYGFEITRGKELELYWNNGLIKTWHNSFLNTLNDGLVPIISPVKGKSVKQKEATGNGRP